MFLEKATRQFHQVPAPPQALSTTKAANADRAIKSAHRFLIPPSAHGQYHKSMP
jgi:hypothetical protein